MSTIKFFLFRKLRIETDVKVIQKVEPRKAEELLVYLLLHRDQPQSRERLADVLWCDLSSEQSKSYLRKALWQLQSELDSFAGQDLLLVDGDWLQINPNFALWLDIDILERAFRSIQGIKGRYWEKKQAKVIQEATNLFEGDLLEGWYEDWCLDERERLRYQYLAMLDKLMDYCESQQQYDYGLLFGERILRYDRAREHTHRRVMRLQYLSGNRTAALRQYRKCVQTLREELDVEPAQATRYLFEMIRIDGLGNVPSAKATAEKNAAEPGIDSLVTLFSHLNDFEHSLAMIQAQLSNDMQAIQKTFGENL